MPFCAKCGAQLPDANARFCPSCGAPVAPSAKRSEVYHQSYKVEGKPNLVINVGVLGSIDVKKGSDGEVVLDAEIIEPGSIDLSAKQSGDVITVSSRNKSWNPLNWGSYFASGGPRTNLRITAPVETNLKLETAIDRILVSEISGTIDAESKTGSIRFQGCGGALGARTHTGSIDLDDVNGTVNAKSTTGPIRFSGTLSSGENSFRATTGSVDIALRGEPSLKLDASTTIGQIACSTEISDAKYDRGDYVGQRLSGRLGTGEGRLILETTIGSISIHK